MLPCRGSSIDSEVLSLAPGRFCALPATIDVGWFRTHSELSIPFCVQVKKRKGQTAKPFASRAPSWSQVTPSEHVPYSHDVCASALYVHALVTGSRSVLSAFV